MKHIVIDLEMNKIARSSEARKICKSEIIPDVHKLVPGNRRRGHDLCLE